MKNILLVTGTRAEYSLLKSVILKLRNQKKKFNLIIIVTGTHLSKNFGYTINEIINDKIKIDHKLNLNISKTTSLDISKYLSRAIHKFSKKINLLKPDITLILGDRYEIFAAAIASTIMNVPIAHIHGGELTEGAIDDVFRHSISKMSHIHFTATEIYRKRVIQLGENPKNVFNVGSIGVENIKNSKFFSKKYIEKKLKINFKKKILLITLHPETNNKKISFNYLENLFSVLKDLTDTTLIFTGSNADKYGDNINARIKKFISKKKNSYFFKSLGQKLYFSCAKISDAIIGNSSSGIIEIPSLKKPVVNIGIRQKGRVSSNCVIHTDFDKKNISRAINKVYNKNFLKKIKNSKNPYDNNRTSNKIVQILSEIKLNNILNKVFYDTKR